MKKNAKKRPDKKSSEKPPRAQRKKPRVCPSEVGSADEIVALEGLARVEYARVKPLLIERGCYAESDEPILIAWTRAVATAEIAARQLDALGLTSKVDHVPSAWSTIYDRATKQLIRLAERLGLSPLDRQRVKPEAALVDEFDGELAE